MRSTFAQGAWMGGEMKDDLKDAPAQQRALDAILDAWNRDEPIRTAQELADKLGVSKSRAYNALTRLVKRRLITWARKPGGRAKTGCIKPKIDSRPVIASPDPDFPLTQDGYVSDDVRRVPLLWRAVAASPPIVAGEYTTGDENIRDYLPLPARHVRGADVFMVEVEGDSMTGDGILDGDYVLVVSDPTPRDGEMVVALVGGDATVKRLWHQGSAIRLEPSNPDFDPIIPEEGDVAIRGRVIGVVRWHIKQGRRNDRRQAR